MNDMLSKVKKVQSEHAGWDFETAFRHVISTENHTQSFGRPKPSPGDAVLVAEASGLDIHPKLKQELYRHAKLEQSRTTTDVLGHAKRLAKIRQLMESDKTLSFDSAFSRIIE
jgi:hypothetical protein